MRWYKVMRWIRNHKLFIGPQWMGHTLWLWIPSCQWSYNRLWSWNIWCIQHPLTTKRLRVELNVIRIVSARALFWQFWWKLMLFKLAPHRHYRLFQTRKCTHRKSKLICWQLKEKYKINWIRLWTRRGCQSKREQRRFQCWITSKENIWLMHPYCKCSCLTQG